MKQQTLRSLVLLGLLVVGLRDAEASSPPGAGGTTGGSTIILVRHAERVSNNGDLPLSEAGRERAALLAQMLGHTGITHVFTSEMIRTRETAAPLATQLGLTPVTVPVAQSDALVAQLDRLPEGAVALVVNHGGPIPVIIQKLGAAAPTAIGEHQFDRLFVVMRATAGRASVVELRYGKPSEAPAPDR
jgi:broad specificity phosphatase PhoE